MSFTELQNVNGNVGSGTSVAVTLPSSVALNDLIVVSVGENHTTGVTVSDTIGNAYSQVDPYQVDPLSHANTSIYWAINKTAGTTTVTIADTAAAFIGVVVVVYHSTVAGAFQVDGTLHGGNNGTLSASGNAVGPSFTPPSADLAIAAVCHDQSVSIASNTPWSDNAGATSNANGNNSNGEEYDLAPSGSAITPSWAIGGAASWSCAYVAFTIPSVPTAPTIKDATAGDTKATINYGLATGTGIDQYRVTPSTGTPATYSTVLGQTWREITGLTNGTAYTFTVAAHNSTGWSAESAASNSVTPTTRSATDWGGLLLDLGYIVAGNHANVTASDTLDALSETDTRILTLLRTSPDTLAALSETSTRNALHFVRTSPDTISAISETATRLLSLIRTSPDSLSALSETLIRGSIALIRSGADTLAAISETAVAQKGVSRTITDTLGALSDVANRGALNFVRTSPDTINALSEGANRILTFLRSGTDAPSALSETISRHLAFNRTSPDTISGLSESVIRGANTLTRTGTDTLSALSEVAQRLAASFTRSSSDTLPAVSDNAIRNLISRLRSGTDALGALSETLNRNLTFNRTSTDTIPALSETVTRAALHFVRTISDGLGALSEVASAIVSGAAGNHYVLTAADSLASLVESLTKTSFLPRTSTETLPGLSEIAAKIVSSSRIAADTLGPLSESLTRLITNPRIILEAINPLVDVVIRAPFSNIRSATESMPSITEIATRIRSSYLSAIDNIPGLIDQGYYPTIINDTPNSYWRLGDTRPAPIFSDTIQNGNNYGRVWQSIGTDATGTLTWWENGGNPATITNNIVTLSGGIVAGHPDWKDCTFFLRVQWTTGALPVISVHYKNGISFVDFYFGANYCEMDKWLDGLNPIYMTSSGFTPVNNTWYWLSLQAAGTTYTGTIYADNAGVRGSQLMQISATATDAVLANGQVTITSGGGPPINCGGAFPNVCYVDSIRPARWNATPTGAGFTTCEPAFCLSDIYAYGGSQYSLSIYNPSSFGAGIWYYSLTNGPATQNYVAKVKTFGATNTFLTTWQNGSTQLNNSDALTGTNDWTELWTSSPNGGTSLELDLRSYQGTSYFSLPQLLPLNNAVDVVGGHTATAHNAVLSGVAGATADGDTATTFGGTMSDPGYYTTNYSPSIPGAFSFEGWYNHYSKAWSLSHEMIISGWNGSIYLSILNGATFFSVQLSGSQQLLTGELAPSAGWHHVVATWDTTTMCLYLDGVLSNSVTPTGGVTQWGTIHLGTYDNASLFFTGALDELALYSYALSATQVLNHYKAGRSGAFRSLALNRVIPEALPALTEVAVMIWWHVGPLVTYPSRVFTGMRRQFRIISIQRQFIITGSRRWFKVIGISRKFLTQGIRRIFKSIGVIK